MITDVALANELDLSTSEGKYSLAKIQLEQPQTVNSITHRFGPGVYIREAIYPAYTLVIGQEHVGAHINMLLKGSINVFDKEGRVVTLYAPHMFVAEKGSKIGYTKEEVVWQNIYATTETDIETLETTLFSTPDFFKEFLAKKLEDETPLHQEDREDYEAMLVETGWTKEEVQKIADYSGDKIPFPYGNYQLSSGDSPIQGKGMFATANLYEGMTIAPMRLGGFRTPAGYLVNHSKNPNCIALIDIEDNMYLVAKQNIQGMVGGQLGDELTLDYRQVMQTNSLLRIN